jgi:hypothetical protein
MKTTSSLGELLYSTKQQRNYISQLQPEETYEDSELCVMCRKKPFFYKKWKMCRTCHHRLYTNGKLQDYPQYETTWRKQKISDECLTDMVNEGFTTAQIARTCDMSRQGVHLRVDQTEYKSKHMWHNHYEIIFLYKIGFTLNEIEEMVNAKRGTASNILNKYKIKRPIKNKTVIYRLYDEGYHPIEIAEKLSITESTVRTTLYKYEHYRAEKVRDPNKHLFEVNFLCRLGFHGKEISQYTNMHYTNVQKLTDVKFKKHKGKKGFDLGDHLRSIFNNETAFQLK